MWHQGQSYGGVGSKVVLSNGTGYGPKNMVKENPSACPCRTIPSLQGLLYGTWPIRIATSFMIISSRKLRMVNMLYFGRISGNNSLILIEMLPSRTSKSFLSNKVRGEQPTIGLSIQIIRVGDNGKNIQIGNQRHPKKYGIISCNSCIRGEFMSPWSTTS